MKMCNNQMTVEIFFEFLKKCHNQLIAEIIIGDISDKQLWKRLLEMHEYLLILEISLEICFAVFVQSIIMSDFERE